MEAFSPKAMKPDWGLDYETLRQVHKPDLVMASTCLNGQYGAPTRSLAGFGTMAAAISGLLLP